MWELVLSTRALRDPSTAPLHIPWARMTRERVRGMDLLPLFALVPPRGYLPDFITPPPESPLADFEDELAAVRAAPHERVRFEVGVRVEEGMDAELAAPFLSSPRRAVERLADALAAYWEVALAPHWPRVRALLEADVLHRARRLTEAGPSAVLADLHPDVRWRDEGLDVAVAYSTTVELAGRGIVLMPTAFPARASAITSSFWQPTVMYPARGVGLLWEPGAPAPSAALSGVLGRGRAAVLLALDAPRTTGEVARRLEITAGGASQHLTALRAAGLVTSARHGRSVLYARSPLADQLAG
jgi:DNA-binding transcriptional ArsR family regulator